MAKFISTIVEDAPKGIYLIACYHSNEHKDENGNMIKEADILKAHKKVIFFDEKGGMTVKYFTEDEWNNQDYYNGSYRMKGKAYTPAPISHYSFIKYLNGSLFDMDIKDAIEDITSGRTPINPDDLSPRSKRLIEYVEKWDAKTPFDFERRGVCQHSYEDNGETRYTVDCFITAI